MRNIEGSLEYRSANTGAGYSLVEVMIALCVIAAGTMMLIWAISSGLSFDKVSRERLGAIRSAEMEVEELVKIPFDKLPPEEHILRSSGDDNGPRSCRVKLGFLPVEGTVKVFQLGDKPFEGSYKVNYSNGTVTFPREMSRRRVFISYEFEYPRRTLAVVPETEPPAVKLGNLRLERVIRIIDEAGNSVPSAFDSSSKVLKVGPKYSGKVIIIEYRGSNDRGVVKGEFLANDLTAYNSKDCDVKLMELTETWKSDGRDQKIGFSYVRAR